MIKYVLALASVSVSAQSMFDKMSKEQLSEYEITVTHKPSGKQVGKFTRAEYKVVRLGTGIKVEDVHAIAGWAYEQGEQAEIKSTTYSLIGSIGPGKSGLSSSTNGTTSTVSEKLSPVGQLMGCATRDRLGICLSAASNAFFGMGVKVDFK